MQEQYICKHFKIHELVPQHVYEDRGEKAWELLDVRALMTLDDLRDIYGPITVNNWFWGGDFQWSGLRTELSPYGGMYSQHRFGRAFDCKFKDISAEEVRCDLIMNPQIVSHINSIELETSWVHFDIRNCDQLMTYKP